MIYCGGKNTEPSYFRKLRLPNVYIEKKGLDPLRLTRQVIKLMELSKYDEYWVVFDKDEYSDQDFNQAIQLADQNRIRVAYLNQAFEFWLLLHFQDHNGSKLNRSEYGNKLCKFLSPLGAEYDSKRTKIVNEQLFEILDSEDTQTGKIRILQAITRAKKIFNKLDHLSPAKEESSTTVFMLVEELLKYR